MYRPGRTALLAVLAVFFLIAGCTDRIGKNKEELLKEGIKMAHERNPRGAIVLFKNALENDRNFFEARFQLAKAYYSTGNFDSSEKELQEVTRQSPSLRDARILLAKVYLQKSKPDDALKLIAGIPGGKADDADMFEITGWANALKGDYAKAVDFLDQAVARDDRISSVILLSRVFMQMGRDDAAMEQISGALKKEPSNAEALYLLAGLQTKGGDSGAAIKTYDRIIKEHPSDAEAYFKKGMLYMQGMQYDEALALADRLISALPNRPQGHALRGIALFHKKNFNDSVVSLQKSLSIMPSVSGYYFLGLSHYYRNEPEQAMSQFHRALDLNPSLVQARTLVSLILLKQKRTDDAIAEIKKVIDTSKDNAFAHDILGSAYMAKGRYDEGIEEFNKALALDPRLTDAHIKKGLYNLGRGKPRTVQAHMMLADLYMKKREYALAISAYDTLLKANPDYVPALNNLAYLYAGGYGSKADALKLASKAYGLAPGNGGIADTLGYALLINGKTAEALKILEKAAVLLPKNPSVYYHISLAYKGMGDRVKAVENLQRAVALGDFPEAGEAMLMLAELKKR